MLKPSRAVLKFTRPREFVMGQSEHVCKERWCWEQEVVWSSQISNTEIGPFWVLLPRLCKHQPPSLWLLSRTRVWTGKLAVQKQLVLFFFSKTFFWCGLFFKKLIIICLFIFACTRSWLLCPASSSCDEWALLLVVVCGLLVAVASLVVEPRLKTMGSVV